MRWEDERYVKLYTRDTVDWLALSFEAQALWVLLLRKFDGAGIIELGRQGKKGIAAAIGHASRWATVEPALEELLVDGCLVIEGTTAVGINFIAAQEARASDKARKQAQRERDMAKALAGGSGRASVTGAETEGRIGREQSRLLSHGVTRSHEDQSQSVTTSPAQPSPAQGSLTSPSAPGEPTIDTATGVLEPDESAHAGARAHVAEEVPAGPKTIVRRSCFDCPACQSESYAVQGDSGQDVYCAHPSFPVPRDIGDTTWETPDWCPAVERPARPAPEPVVGAHVSDAGQVVLNPNAIAPAAMVFLQPELPGTPPPPGPDDVMRVWNEKAPPKCPRVQKMTDGRVKAAKARLEEHNGEPGGALAWWERVVAKVAASSFLRGDKAAWCADIDFVLKPGKLVGILEGKYDDVKPAGDVRTGSVRAEDCHHSEKVGVVSVEDWVGGK